MPAVTVDDILEELKVQLKPFLKKERELAPPADINLFERKVLDVLGNEAVHIDSIADLSGISTADALVQLLSLEFKGLVKQLPGKMFLKH